jgi:orotate phosphoribosyltransferase
VTEADLLESLQAKGAVMRGHFRLSSGRHSDTFVQKFRLFEDPVATVRAGEMLVARWPEGFDVVAAPAVGAVVFGFATALAAGARSIFSERVDGEMSFRRGFDISAGERVLVVEDVVTTGGSAAEVVQLAARTGGSIVGVGALVDRVDPSRQPLGASLRALITLEAKSWAPEQCPLCAAGASLDDPGSRRLDSENRAYNPPRPTP